MKPDLGVDQDQQMLNKQKPNCKADRIAKKGNFIAQFSVRQNSPSSGAAKAK